jgi:glutamate-1-semialdehyde 2,1-aminomutase
MAALDGLLKKAGIPAQVIGEPPLFDVVFTDQPIKDYRDTLKATRRSPRASTSSARRGHHEGREQVLRQPGPYPRRHRHTIGAWTEAIAELKR